MARALLYGTAVSPGYAIGRVHLLHVAGMVEKRRIAPRQAEREQQRLRAASESVREALREAMGKVPEDLAEYREVIAAQMELARDPKLLESAAKRIESDLICASWALDETINQLCALFDKMEDPYLRDRAQDIRAVGLRLREGITRYGLEKAFGKEGRAAFQAMEKKGRLYQSAGLLETDGNRMALTPQGFLVSNSLIAELLPD